MDTHTVKAEADYLSAHILAQVQFLSCCGGGLTNQKFWLAPFDMVCGDLGASNRFFKCGYFLFRANNKQHIRGLLAFNLSFTYKLINSWI
jgi:hypothetical protein